ncbi:hypothetical protein [Candidatus Desulfovibrio trichonymphae]|uniref:hypothetical protein n=1 Tax=Candidatus Desulfovibrio trichonymphae TaxID=1725232 RepID=UPI0011AB444B|nr:hypothetical protein [Candidatus Desulfovibrio trichonymphae]GHV00506.1 hypothetical protein AGMMS50248_10260 [Deltaproteobacteria bacterium]
MPFAPQYTITPNIAKSMLRIEAVKAVFESLPVTLHVLRSLRESARLLSVHYSTPFMTATGAPPVWRQRL